MASKPAIFVIILAALLPTFYNLGQKLVLMYNNAPSRFISINNLKSSEVKFSDTFRSCEDILLVESKGIAIFSCDAGRETWNTVMGIFIPGPVPNAEIYAYSYGNANTPDSESLTRFKIQGYNSSLDFHTIGLAYDEETSTLFVTNHRKEGKSIELFKLDFDTFTANHFRTIQHPLFRSPNSIALLNSHQFLVTNDHHFLMENSRFLSMAETLLGLPLSTVLHVDISSLLEDPASPTRVNIVARLPFANGIEIVNETTVAVASTTSTAVYFYDMTKPDSINTTLPTLTYKSKVSFPFWVDNIQFSGDGTLYAAGHPHPATLNEYALSRHECSSPEKLAAADESLQKYCRNVKGLSGVSKWTESGGVERVYFDDKFPTSTTAAFDSKRKIGIITGLYTKGLLVWRE
ncbi:calcium-dependent phosphotriesterase [Daldinia caldariorum]|uniref:calcium-dependent phosphotriesterase n=1 Tax=Daldinia caldariorum TaxID=326644 RepID=UPI0020079BF8|nr:calcium-dependent phosphotriesterase [Daldinia caldariorum]KAI1464035.1 calcium-dependent phosphotriesterase [Daldinia caldariorum]